MNLDYNKTNGLIPAIIQDADSKNVLMLGYMNEEALKKTVETGLVTFYSRSKKRLWTKGENSKNYLELLSIQNDCDNDTLLIMAKPKGPTCHKGTDTCFANSNKKAFDLGYLESIIQKRKMNLEEKSYTASLLKKGINKVAQKVGEEAVELLIEAKDDNKELFLGEAADLMYHYLVLLAAKDYTLQEVLEVLEKRNRK